jgi:hypothetical protein
MGKGPALAIVAFALSAGGCSASGVHVVRGVVSARGAIGPEPLAGAAVQCRAGRDGVPQYARAVTGHDGAYQIDYPYDGTWVPLVKPKGGDPHVEFSAPGYQPRLVKLKGGAEAGVARGKTGPYHRLDVTLVPAQAATGGPAGR